MKKVSARDICFIGIFTAIIVVLGQISIPMPYGVPMTLQTFAIPFAGIILGAKKGTLATLIYVMLGAVGVPVFAGFTGGLGIVFGATGGFILSFPFMAWCAGAGSEKEKVTWVFGGLLAGSIINYLCGMFMFSFVMSSNLNTAFVACVLPFIPTTIVKIVLASTLGLSIKNILIKAKVMV